MTALVTSLLIIASASLLSAGILRALKPLLQRYALARPNARSSHRIPTPQGGGIAVISATLAVSGTSAVVLNLSAPVVLFGATIFIALVGIADDIRSIPVLPRLLLQAAAVVAVLAVAPADLRIIPACPLWIERALLLLGGLWFVNLVNFMDGLDLMTVAEVVPITAAMILLGWSGTYPQVPALVAAALCGAMLGFAPFNRPVAKVFLGDVGSLPIGLLLGWCLLQLAWHQQLTAALLLPLYYLADTTITLFRRMVRREPFWTAHRSHYYQRATDNGFSVPHVVGEVFVLNVVLALLALASTAHSSTPYSNLSLLGAGAGAVSIVLYRFSLSSRTKRKS
jgi:UDP-N-acetylmuramyl pentapeptide phosphotransferase/UDP-N-acetylglucosamine-1-phosphate transferase